MAEMSASDDVLLPVVAKDDVTVLEAAGVGGPAASLADEAAAATKSTELFRTLFEKLDLKQDGRIDAEELVVGLHNMGYLHLSQVPPPRRVLSPGIEVSVARSCQTFTATSQPKTTAVFGPSTATYSIP
jgi:hypothetical protein